MVFNVETFFVIFDDLIVMFDDCWGIYCNQRIYVTFFYFMWFFNVEAFFNVKRFSNVIIDLDTDCFSTTCAGDGGRLLGLYGRGLYEQGVRVISDFMGPHE